MAKYYHATTAHNLAGIIEDGIINRSMEGVVYCAESSSDAAKFLALRLVKPIHIIEFEIPDDIKVEEQFDHNESFFGCKAYGVLADIPSKYWTNFYIVE